MLHSQIKTTITFLGHAQSLHDAAKAQTSVQNSKVTNVCNLASCDFTPLFDRYAN